MIYPIQGTNEVETSKNNSQHRRERQGSVADSASISLNRPIILTFRDIANIVECVAMFDFIKGLSMLRIVAEPCADSFASVNSIVSSLTIVLDGIGEMMNNLRRDGVEIAEISVHFNVNAVAKGVDWGNVKKNM